jgi:hypothetical protein
VTPTGSLVLLTALAAGAAVVLWPARHGPEWTPVSAPWARGLSGIHVPGGAERGGRRGAAPVPPAVGLVPEALELVALALLGGGSLAAAVSRVGAVLPGPVGRELAQVGARLQAGRSDDGAWDGAGEHWAPARRSLHLAESSGVPPGQALTRSAQDLRRDAVADVEVAAARLGVRLVIPLGLAYLPAFVLTTVLPVVLALTRDLAW